MKAILVVILLINFFTTGLKAASFYDDYEDYSNDDEDDYYSLDNSDESRSRSPPTSGRPSLYYSTTEDVYPYYRSNWIYSTTTSEDPGYRNIERVSSMPDRGTYGIYRYTSTVSPSTTSSERDSVSDGRSIKSSLSIIFLITAFILWF